MDFFLEAVDKNRKGVSHNHPIRGTDDDKRNTYTDEVIGNIFSCREFTETPVENNIKLCYDSKNNCENIPEKKSNWVHNI